VTFGDAAERQLTCPAKRPARHDLAPSSTQYDFRRYNAIAFVPKVISAATPQGCIEKVNMGTSITLVSPEPTLRAESVVIDAGLSTLGEMQVSLLSPSADVRPSTLLGKPLTVQLVLPEGSKRTFHGYVTRFGLGAPNGRFHRYHATVMPWLWFLTRSSNCRVFQDMTVPDIVNQVLQNYPFGFTTINLFRTYEPRVYCVQYRETDFQFIARLLEHEGIYWYFDHDETGHTLVLVDSYTAHDKISGNPVLPYFHNVGQVPSDTEYVTDWTFSREVRSGEIALESYDFERPSTDLGTSASWDCDYDNSKYQLFDFQGDYVKAELGNQWARDRAEAEQAFDPTHTARSNSMQLAVGHTVSLTRHPREDQNTSYLITSTHIRASTEGDESGTAPSGFLCNFRAMPANQPFRAPRLTTRPVMQGPQTAVVVGPAGEEIFTDKYGRVKVQFHWDRYGQKNEKSSCWVRVSHPWAGKNYGAIHIPRIGQEVVVDFLEGDPDQPLITGRVYNAEQMPPWDLPANATQSGILTRSSKDGAYDKANAIRFEDKTGSEQLWIHAERNQDIGVEADETHTVGGYRTKKIGVDEKNTIGANRITSVGGSETLTIEDTRNTQVKAVEILKVGGPRDTSIQSNDKLEVGGNRSVVTTGDEFIGVTGSRQVNVNGSQMYFIHGPLLATVDATMTQNVQGSITMTTRATMNLNAKGGLNINAPAGVNLLGGTTIKSIASSEVKIAADDRSIIGVKDQTTGLKLEITGLNCSQNGNVIVKTIVSSITAAFDKKNVGLKACTSATDVCTGGTIVRGATCQVIN